MRTEENKPCLSSILVRMVTSRAQPRTASFNVHCKGKLTRKANVTHHFLGAFQRPLTLILLQRHRDKNGSRIVIQIGGDIYYILLSAKRRAYFCKSIAIEMGGVWRYFSKVSGSKVDLTLLNFCTPLLKEVHFSPVGGDPLQTPPQTRLCKWPFPYSEEQCLGRVGWARRKRKKGRAKKLRKFGKEGAWRSDSNW